MKYLFKDWRLLEERIKNSKRTLLLFDYDGTLTPIVKRPELARLHSGIKAKLSELAGMKKFILGIISGRALRDIRGLVKIDGLIFAGNHGLELKGRGIDFLHPNCKYVRPYLDKLVEGLKKRLSKIEGVIVEDKGLSLSIHYRLIKQKDFKELDRVFKDLVKIYIKSGKIITTAGKKVYELRPHFNWNKGRAVLLIYRLIKKRFKLENSELILIYAGDDRTDEDAFCALRRKNDFSLFVGKPLSSTAKYFLRDVGEVEEFLRRLVCLKN